MVLEIAILQIKDGQTEAFVKVMNEQGNAHLMACPGCRSARTLGGVENPGKAVILAEWDSVEAHNAAKSSESFASFKQVAGPFFGTGATMEHFELG